MQYFIPASKKINNFASDYFTNGEMKFLTGADGIFFEDPYPSELFNTKKFYQLLKIVENASKSDATGYILLNKGHLSAGLSFLVDIESVEETISSTDPLVGPATEEEMFKAKNAIMDALYQFALEHIVPMLPVVEGCDVIVSDAIPFEDALCELLVTIPYEHQDIIPNVAKAIGERFFNIVKESVYSTDFCELEPQMKNEKSDAKKLSERATKFLLGPHPKISDEFFAWLQDNGFFTAPASTKYHGNYEGCLFDHSLAVTEELLMLTKEVGLTWQREESPLIIGMFHDLCKIDQYRHPITGKNPDGSPVFDLKKWEYNTDTLLHGHGDKSVMLLSQHITLTGEEIACITYHMGAFTDSSEWKNYTNAIHKYHNVLWTHQADMIASHILGT